MENTDYSNFDFDAAESTYQDMLKNENPNNVNILNVIGDLHDSLSKVSSEHGNFLKGALPMLEDSGSVTREISSADAKYVQIMNAVGELVQQRSVDTNGSVDAPSSAASSSGGASGGGTGGYSSGYSDSGSNYSGSSGSSSGFQSGVVGESAGSNITPSSSKGSDDLVRDASSLKVTSNGEYGVSSSDIDVDDFQTSAYGGLTNPTVAAVGGAVSSGAVGVVSSVGSDSAYVNNDYALGNHVVEQSFISNMTDDERNSFVNKLEDVGYNKKEIEAIINGDVQTSKVLVDELSDTLEKAYISNPGIREDIKSLYGVDVFNDDGMIDDNKLSLVLTIDDYSGKDDYSIINTLSSKYGINMVDQNVLESYAGQLESLILKKFDIKNAIEKKYGFDVYNPDCTINKDRLTLAMLIDKKGGNEYSLASIISDVDNSELTDIVETSLIRPSANGDANKNGSGGVYAAIAAAGALGIAGVGAGVLIDKKNKEEKNNNKDNADAVVSVEE